VSSIPAKKTVVEFPGQRTRAGRVLEVAFDRYERYWFGNPQKGQAKIALHFTITEPGPDFGESIAAYYRLDRTDKRGRCYAGQKSRIVRAFGHLFPDYVGEMPLPLSRLKGIAARVKTAWVTHDRDGHPLPPQQQYEKVETILGRSNG